MTSRKFPLRKCHDTSCLAMCSSTPAQFDDNHPDNQTEWCLFFFSLSGAESQTITLNCLDGKFRGQVKLRLNGGFEKPQPVLENQPIRETRGCRKWPVKTLRQQFLFFGDRKAHQLRQLVLISQHECTRPGGALPWCCSAAADCVFTKSISPKTNESHLLNNLTSVCCWLH